MRTRHAPPARHAIALRDGVEHAAAEIWEADLEALREVSRLAERQGAAHRVVPDERQPSDVLQDLGVAAVEHLHERHPDRLLGIACHTLTSSGRHDPAGAMPGPTTNPSYAISRSLRGRPARHTHVEEHRAALASL